jgi:hypothetical protein
MRLGLVLLVICASVADARPRRPDFDAVVDLPRCDRAKSWAKLRTCLETRGVKVTVLFEVEGAKLVVVPERTSGETKPLRLFVQIGDDWQMTTFHGVENASNELLGFKRIADGYRIDQGQVFQSSATLGSPGTSTRVWLRRRLTTICFSGTASCASLVTVCDAMIDGKTYWSFHGTLHAKNKSLMIVGDNSRAGSHCMPARHVFSPEPVGDPLE